MILRQVKIKPTNRINRQKQLEVIPRFFNYDSVLRHDFDMIKQNYMNNH
jgi:hypothetical protein